MTGPSHTLVIQVLTLLRSVFLSLPYSELMFPPHPDSSIGSTLREDVWTTNVTLTSVAAVYLGFSVTFLSVESEPGPDWETRVPETPDVAGRLHIKPPVDESSPLPTFNLRDENFTFSTPVDSRGLPLMPPVTDQNASAAEEQQAAVGKPRKQRTPKTLWIKTPGI